MTEIDASTYHGRFFGVSEAQEIIDMGAAAFAACLIAGQPANAKLFLAGAGFDLMNNGLFEEGKSIIETAKECFPDASIEKVLEYAEEIKSSEAKEALVDRYSKKIYQDYDDVSIQIF